MKRYLSKASVLLLSGLLAISAVAANVATAPKAKRKAPCHYATHCVKNKKGHRVCKKTKVCKK